MFLPLSEYFADFGVPGPTRRFSLRPVHNQIRAPCADFPPGFRIWNTAVAAFRSLFPGIGPLKAPALPENALHQFNGFPVAEMPAVEEKIKAGLTAHGSEVTYRLLLRGISQRRGNRMLGEMQVAAGRADRRCWDV